jgi:hypothetical protein
VMVVVTGVRSKQILGPGSRVQLTQPHGIDFVRR